MDVLLYLIWLAVGVIFYGAGSLALIRVVAWLGVLSARAFGRVFGLRVYNLDGTVRHPGRG